HRRIAGCGSRRGLEVGEEILALVNLAVGVHVGELQREQPARDRFVAGAYGRPQRLIGTEHDGLFARHRLRFKLSEHAHQHTDDKRAKPPALHGAPHHPSWKTPPQRGAVSYGPYAANHGIFWQERSRRETRDAAPQLGRSQRCRVKKYSAAKPAQLM